MVRISSMATAAVVALGLALMAVPPHSPRNLAFPTDES